MMVVSYRIKVGRNVLHTQAGPKIEKHRPYPLILVKSEKLLSTLLRKFMAEQIQNIGVAN